MIVVDASVAVKWIVAEEYTEQAQTLYQTSLQRGEQIVAPPLLPSEVTNTVRQQMRGARSLTRDEALALLDEFLAFTFDLRAPQDLYRHALLLAADFDLPAVYDAQYLALAQHYECDLWTADERLLRRLNGALPFVRWIGDYAP